MLTHQGALEELSRYAMQACDEEGAYFGGVKYEPKIGVLKAVTISMWVPQAKKYAAAALGMEVLGVGWLMGTMGEVVRTACAGAIAEARKEAA